MEVYRGSNFTDIQNKLSSYGINVDIQYAYDPSVDKDSAIELKNAGGDVLEQGALLHEGDSVTLIVNTGVAPQDNSKTNTSQPSKSDNSSNKPSQNITETTRQKTETAAETKPTKSTQAQHTETTKAKETETKPKQTQQDTEAPKVDPTREQTPQTTMAPEVVDEFIND